MTTAVIPFGKLRLDGGTQPRVKIDTDVVRDYAERIKAGDEFPPVDVFHDGVDYWLAEGFHRYHGYKDAGHKTIPCTIRKGTVRDAILFSCGANGHHGLRRTNADKRKAVETLLAYPEWAQWSDVKVAELCMVSHTFVASVRKDNQPATVAGSPPTKRIGRDGKKRPSTQPTKTQAPSPDSAPSVAQDATQPVPCPNCQSLERDAEGDCAQCHEPLGTPAEKPASRKLKNGREKYPAKPQKEAEKALATLERFFDLVGRHDEFREPLDEIGRGVRNE